MGYRQTNRKIDTGKTLKRWPVLVDRYNYNNWLSGDVYSEDYVYKEKDHSSEAMDNKWEEIKSLSRTKRYFLYNHVKDFFDKIFSNIETHLTQDGRNAVNYLNNDMSVFRARAFDNYDKAEEELQHPERYCGPPPTFTSNFRQYECATF
ncbi:hypothetical protein [Yersinia enterocolitica]|uniref:hypothetical protein n=1 Tax=Yersinia enterocolitica TaxID=630 RepID=UPI00398CBA33